VTKHIQINKRIQYYHPQ